MGAGRLSPDQLVFHDWGSVKLNGTLVYTWIAMAVLVAGSWLITRRLSTGRRVSRWQTMLEVVVGFMRREIEQVSGRRADLFLPFVGTLFLFIAMSALLEIVPGYVAPTGSLSTTGALAACVFVAVPVYGVASSGPVGYLKHYIRPSPFMLPFNVIGELSRTVALAIRLFGNMMSGTKVGAILLSLVPLGPPIIMSLFGLLIGFIQAYVFAILAMVYIASGMRTHERREAEAEEAEEAEQGEQGPKGEQGAKGDRADEAERAGQADEAARADGDGEAGETPASTRTGTGKAPAGDDRKDADDD